MTWLFSKTYTVHCPDGNVKTVYKSIDDAFPLYIPGTKASLGLVGSGIDQIRAEVNAEYASAIHGVLFSLDELNQGLMLTFRGAYIVYKNDPCNHSEFFEREVSKLLDGQQRLRTAKVQIDGLIELVKLQSVHSDKFIKILANIVDRMGLPPLAKATSQQINDARKIAVEMVEEPHES